MLIVMSIIIFVVPGGVIGHRQISGVDPIPLNTFQISRKYILATAFVTKDWYPERHETMDHAGLMLGQGLRCWTSIELALGKCIVSDVNGMK